MTDVDHAAWQALNFYPGEAARWQAAGFTPETADAACDRHLFIPEEARAVLDAERLRDEVFGTGGQLQSELAASGRGTDV